METDIRNLRLLRRWAMVILTAIGICRATGSVAQSYTESVLFGFCDQCSKGYEPRSWLYRESTGNLFGTTLLGSNNGGTVFELAYDGIKQKYSRQILHGFCTRDNCTDGAAPYSGLIADQSGNLYGTTSAKGTHDGGNIYELVFDQVQQKWTYTILYSFCSRAACADGMTPYAGLTVDGSGNLYGTTYAGGAHGYGTVYELAFDQTKQKWVEKVLYSFNCGTNTCPDGGNPALGLYLDSNGNFFGTTTMGANSVGAIFELSFDQAKQKWVEAVLYSFCGEKSCADGSSPSGRIAADSAGNLYGTTAGGGSHGQGTVYELSFSGNQWSYSVLYSFCSGETCPDGQTPSGILNVDATPTLTGTTYAGGANNSGTVYQLTYDQQTKQWVHSILYSFCAKENCTDGDIPTAGVIPDGSGNFYGTTEAGDVDGTVFELSPSQ